MVYFSDVEGLGELPHFLIGGTTAFIHDDFLVTS